jgi:uncharacterized OB-fold protein
VTRGIKVSRCGDCGWRGLPHRLRCPRCGSEEVVDALVRRGRLLELTTLQRAPGGLERPVTVGAALIENGGVVIVRVDGDLPVGGLVALVSDTGAPVARALG